MYANTNHALTFSPIQLPSRGEFSASAAIRGCLRFQHTEQSIGNILGAQLSNLAKSRVLDCISDERDLHLIDAEHSTRLSSRWQDRPTAGPWSGSSASQERFNGALYPGT